MDEILFKPNALIKGVLDVNSVEYKAFNLILHKAQLDIQRDIDTTLIPISLTLEELQTIFKNTAKNRLNSIGETLEKLSKTTIKWEESKVVIIGKLITKVKLEKNENTIHCYMDAEVVRVLKEYNKKGYAPIDLTLVKKANGYYTQRLYELFRSWSGLKEETTIELEELKKILNLQGKSYNIYGNIKKRVINPSLEELEKNFNMKVKFIEILGARKKVIALKFKINDLEPRTYDFSKNNKVDSDGNKPLEGQIDIEEVTATEEQKQEATPAPEAPKKAKYEFLTDLLYADIKRILDKLEQFDIKEIKELQLKILAKKIDIKLIENAIDSILEDITLEDFTSDNYLKEIRERAKKLQEKEVATTAIEEIKETTAEAPAPEAIKKEVKKAKKFDIVIADITRDLEKNNIFIDAVELTKLKEKYSEIILTNAINILIQNNAEKKINNHLNYLISILENKKNESKTNVNKVSNSNSSKPSNFDNFTQREYDYNKLENQLLGWDLSEDDEE